MRKLVIIPTYNEKENISAMIDKVFLAARTFRTCSSSTTVRPTGRLKSSGNAGKSSPKRFTCWSAAANRGWERPDPVRGSAGDWTTDSTTFAKWTATSRTIPTIWCWLYEAAAEGNDVVVGSRYVQGVNVVNWPMSRLLMSYFASMYVRIVTRMPLRDATAGFVCYSRHALETLDLDAVRMKGYGFQIEMKYSAWRLGLKLKEVSIIFVERREGTSKMSGGIFREAFFGVLGLPLRKIRAAKKA